MIIRSKDKFTIEDLISLDKYFDQHPSNMVIECDEEQYARYKKQMSEAGTTEDDLGIILKVTAND